MSASEVTLSLVIPVYNEADNLLELYQRIRAVLSALGESYEIILVNDGSSDDSLDVMKQLRMEDVNVRIVDLSRNWGHQIALTVGLDRARGQAVITMDADLQHPPELIPRLLAEWRKGYEVVQTIRQNTADSGLLKRLTSVGYYALFRTVAQTDVPAGAADFRLVDRKVLRAFRQLRERRRFIRGMVPWLGFRTTYVPYEAGRRFAGRSKYSPLRMLRLALAGVVSFSTVPLRLALYSGLVLVGLNSIYAAYVLYAYLFRHAVISGWTSLMLAMLFLSSVQFVMIGILGEYVATIVEEVKRRPLYAIREEIGFEMSKGAEK